MENLYHAKIQEIHDPEIARHQLRLLVKREDLLHPHVSGNKFRKLKYNLQEAERAGHKTILTFGGAYSNHIYATAAAGKEFSFKTIGIIRGEEHLPLNATLQFARDIGMALYYLNRTEYKNKSSVEFLATLEKKFGRFYLIPEGGTNVLAVKGCTEIIEDIEVPYDVICTPCGTGGTMAGLVAGLNGHKKVIGFSSLKGGDFFYEEVSELVKNYNGKIFGNWEIDTAYHFGGYAKVKPELISFIKTFKQNHQIQLDPIYTGKMFYGIYDLMRQHYFKEHTTILALHTGGLQGIPGFEERFGIRF